jgi:hypothetical protein
MRICGEIATLTAIPDRAQTEPMSKSGDQWVERMGGLGPGETPEMQPLKAEMIGELEQKLVSGKLSADEVEATLTRIRNLKGLLPVEFDYDPPDDDD